MTTTRKPLTEAERQKAIDQVAQQLLWSLLKAVHSQDCRVHYHAFNLLALEEIEGAARLLKKNGIGWEEWT